MHLQQYAAATRVLRDAYAQNSNDQTALAINESLLAAGRDLEAASFMKRHNEPQKPPRPHWLESLYAEAGAKQATTKDLASDLLYAAVGFTNRPSHNSRLWFQYDYLKQDRNPGSIKQHTLFARWNWFFKNKVFLTPIVSASFTQTAYAWTTQTPKQYYQAYPLSAGLLEYKSAGVEQAAYRESGSTNFLYAALETTYPIGPWQFSLELGAHRTEAVTNTGYQYQEQGITDSFFNGFLLGSQPYAAQGSGSLARIQHMQWIGQAGLSASIRLPFWRERLTLRGSAYYLATDTASSNAWEVTLAARPADLCWLQAGWFAKGFHPLLLSREGSYFNTPNDVRGRLSASVQLFPLRKNSLFLTIQAEEQRRFVDKAIIKYNSFFITFRRLL